MPLPSPYCGLCKPKDLHLGLWGLFGVIFSLAFLIFTVVMLVILSGQGKLGGVTGIVIGLFIMFGAIFHFILQIVLFSLEERKSFAFEASRAWLIQSVMALGICSYSVYYFVSESGGVGENNLMTMLLAVPFIYHVYVWYVVLAFTYRLHLDAMAAAAAPSPPPVITVVKATKSNLCQALPNSSGTPHNKNPKVEQTLKPSSTITIPSTTTTAPNLDNVSSSGDHNKTITLINHPD